MSGHLWMAAHFLSAVQTRLFCWRNPLSLLNRPEKFQQSKDVVACEIDDGMALLDLRTSQYVKLNRTGALLWQWIEQGLNLEQMMAEMMNKFDVEEARCESDILALLGQFAEVGLLEERA